MADRQTCQQDTAPPADARDMADPALMDGSQSNASFLSHDARDLLGGGVKAQIMLDGQIYILRKTRAGKLILTK